MRDDKLINGTNYLVNKTVFTIVILLFIVKTYSQTNQSNNDYLNQEEPKDIPLIFAPGLISTEGSFEYPCSFSSDMTEMYFGVNKFHEKGKEKYILQVKRKIDGSWGLPKKINFTGFQESEPILSPDNSKLFFAVHSDTKKIKPHGIWYVTKENDAWSKPKQLSEEINSKKYEYFASLTNNNTIYFTREGVGIFTADFIDGDYTNVSQIDDSINDMKFCGHPYISPDESYLIFDSRERNGFGKADLYISFNSNGTWGTPINLGDKINTEDIEFMPIVSPDGKYLFFCRKSGNERDIYWVEFDIMKYKK